MSINTLHKGDDDDDDDDDENNNNNNNNNNNISTSLTSPSQWPRGLRRRSAAARSLGLWIRIPPGHGCFSVVSVVCCEVEVSATV